MRVALVVSSSLVVLSGLVAGCDGGGGADTSKLVNTPWVLTSGKDVTLSAGIAPSIWFTEGKAHGSSGCNRYTASTTLDGDSLEIGQTAGTQMACPPPADEIERAYLAALPQVATWAIDGEQLVLSDADGNELLRYDVASLTGDWTVTGVLYDNAFHSTITGTELTASFAEDGALTGSGGCNTYTTTYTADKGEITIEPPAATKKLCPDPEGVMQQETAYFQALQDASGYNLDGTTAELLNADGQRLVSFTRAQ